MSYQGIEAEFKLGRGGLLTDETQAEIPIQNLILANNVELQDGIVSREPGSKRWNLSEFSGSVIELADYWPQEHLQRFLVLTSDGRVWKAPDRETKTEVLPFSASEPATLNLSPEYRIVIGGSEIAGNQRKAFVFSGYSQLQVIRGDESVRRNVANPSADWSMTNYPRGGVVHRSRLFVWGADPHRVYASDDDDHEQFVTGAVQFAVYPGEGDRVVGGYVWKGRLFIFKYPTGVYLLEDSDASATNWFFRKLSGEFGISGARAMTEALDDMLVGNAVGSVTSVRAVQQLGDVESADIFGLLRISNYMNQRMSSADMQKRCAVYDSKRKIAYFSYRSASGSQIDSVMKIDFAKQRPEMTLLSKDQIECLVLRQTVTGKVPYCGSADGYIYETQHEDKEITKVFPPLGLMASALAGAGAGNLVAGSYRYHVTFADASRESTPGSPSNATTVVTPGTDGKISLSSIPVDTTGTATKRRLYRSKDAGAYLFLAEISDNVTTTYVDNIADASLGTANPPSTNGFSSTYLSEFQTPHTDFGFLDGKLAQQTKVFDAIEFAFEPTGKHTISFDYFIDGLYVETKTIRLDRGLPLGEFVLDRDRLESSAPFSVRMRLRGFGRTFSVRVYGSGLLEDFRLEKIRVYFRAANQDQRKPTSGRAVS